MPELIHSAARPLPASKHRNREWEAMCRRWALWEKAPVRPAALVSEDGEEQGEGVQVTVSSEASSVGTALYYSWPPGRPARLNAGGHKTEAELAHHR